MTLTVPQQVVLETVEEVGPASRAEIERALVGDGDVGGLDGVVYPILAELQLDARVGVTGNGWSVQGGGE